MIVTMKAPTRRAQARAEFECIKFGIDYESFEGLHLDLTVPSVARAKIISDKVGGEIVAVIDKIAF